MTDRESNKRSDRKLICVNRWEEGKIAALCHSAKYKQTSAVMNEWNVLGGVFFHSMLNIFKDTDAAPAPKTLKRPFQYKHKQGKYSKYSNKLRVRL